MTEPPRDEEPAFETPPEGASCHEHPDSFAVVTCPRCGNYACLSCWHEPISRCHACLMRDPIAAGDAVAWEDDRRNPLARYLRTFAAALSPAKSAPGFSRGGVAPALGFLLLSFLPLSMLAGIIPYTATLLFEPVLAWRTIGTPTDAEIAADIAKAAGLGLLVWTAQLVVLGTSYASLVRAYLSKGHPPAAARVLLYRAWLLPLTILLMHLAGMVTTNPDVARTLEALGVIPLVLLISAMIATARMGAGVGRFTSFVVVLVPVVVMLMSQAFLERALQPFLPDSASIAEAVRAVDGNPAEGHPAAGAAPPGSPPPSGP